MLGGGDEYNAHRVEYDPNARFRSIVLCSYMFGVVLAFALLGAWLAGAFSG